MLKVNIIAIGKIKETYYISAVNEYIKRIRSMKINIIELAETNSSKSQTEIISDESTRLLKEAKGYIILLDVNGKMLSSEQLADKIETVTKVASEISFIIGGSYGTSSELKQKADFRLSFSSMTFPHQLMRVICLEQIYRAYTIANNIPYHK